MSPICVLIALTAVLSFVLSALSGKVVIPYLRRLHIGQTISEYVKEHKGKANTPTIGGVMFIIPTVLLTLLAAASAVLFRYTVDGDSWKRLFASLIMILALTAVGFIDDYIKVVKKHNVGLTEIQKTLLQSVIIAAYLATLALLRVTHTAVLIPFTQNFRLELGVFFYPLMFAAIYLFVNGVNFTDGIDGLCASVTLVACCFFIPVTFLLAKEHAFLAAALAGGLLGFLVWNFHPAKVFMGDTGSMFLGGTFVALAFAVDMPLLMLPVGIIYVLEMASDVIQIAVIKLTKGKKKVFKMAPIHHHYQLSGWGEVRIVMTFSAITLIFCVLTGVWLVGLL